MTSAALAARDVEPARADVCLVAMPYAALPRPALGLSILKGVLQADGLTTTVLYANLAFAERVGLRDYNLCCARTPTVLLAGEWTFAEAAFGTDAPPRGEYLRRIRNAEIRVPGYARDDGNDGLVADLVALRAAAGAFVDEVARDALETGARIIGCTSTFEQHTASLAVLRRVKALDPSVVTMLGGANCETLMGAATHRCFAWVDYVVSGEADGLIAPLCRKALIDGRAIPAAELPAGVMAPCHRDGGTNSPRRALFRNLDSLPSPDFTDYFERLQRSALAPAIRPGLPIETSRGCWWGARHPCTFCGLNGSSMSFRSKSPERVLAEMDELESRYGIGMFEAVDNILDAKYLRTLLPQLAAAGGDRRIFYEVKANLTREQVALLVRAGVTWVQPGIESLHSGVLKLMDKGVRGWQNVQLLRAAREFGLRMSWTVLWGFPGEEDDWYAAMAGWLPALEHLQAPGAVAPLRYDRFSVYHKQATALGLRLRPIPAMAHVYPVDARDLEDLTYFFVADDPEGAAERPNAATQALRRRPGVRAVRRAVRRWRKSFSSARPAVCTMRELGDELEIRDTRVCSQSPQLRLRGLARAILLACDRAPVRERLPALLDREHDLRPSAGGLSAVLAELLDARLLLALDERLLTMPIRADIPRLPRIKEYPGGYVDEAALRAPQAVGEPAV